MSHTPRSSKVPLPKQWALGSAAIAMDQAKLSNFLQDTTKVLGPVVPLAVACVQSQSTRGRLKRRPSATFDPDDPHDSRPRKHRKCHSRVPIYLPPRFDDATEHAVHEATLKYCERELGLAPNTHSPLAKRKRKRPDRLFLKLRLTPPVNGRDSLTPRPAKDDHSQLFRKPEDLVPGAIDIPRRKRATSNPPKTAAPALPAKLRDDLDERPDTKIVDPLHLPPPPPPDEVLPVDAPQSPKTPLEHILHFARGNSNVLAKIEKHEKKDAFKRRTSLSTFIGCDEVGNVSLSAYLRTLASVHCDFICSAVDKDTGKDLVGQGLDTIELDMTDEQLADAMSKGGRSSRRRQHNAPPHISKTLDVIQLVFRLWQKMSCAEEYLAQAFIKRLYSSGVVQAVSTLALDVLTLWHKSAIVPEPDSVKRSELVEWCVRLLSTVLVYELSPFSDIWGKVESGLVFRATTEDGKPWLPKILDTVLYLVGCNEMAVARECRLSVSELCQLYVVRCHCPFPEGSEQKNSWKTMLDLSADHSNVLISDNNFWLTAVSSAIQVVRKQEQTTDADFAVAFLHSLFSDGQAAKCLVQKQTSHRDALLEVLAKLLERLDRQLLSSFIQIERTKRAFPGLASSVDLIRQLMSSAILQRELISSREHERKKNYLDAITSIFSRLTKFVTGDVDVGKLMECAREGAFSHVTDSLQKELPSDQEGSGLLPELSDGESEDPQTLKDCAVARLKALAFGASLIGSLGKSMEDGSRDMTQMNGLQILVSSRFNSTRALKKLWGILFKIQAGLEQHIPDGLVASSIKHDKLLSENERNHFSMAVEAVRLRVVSEPKDRSARGTPESTPKQTPKHSSSEGESRTEPKPKRSKVSLSFPDVTRIQDLRKAVTSDFGYGHLDDDPHMLEHIEKTYKGRGEQALARYDPDSEHVTQWCRLLRKNVYIEEAHDLLDRIDKTVGHKCSCMPGNPVGGSTDSQMRIACSNNLCENRSTHMECAPEKCGAGSYCQNQRMQKMQYAKMKTISFPGKGVGIVADEDIPAGSFIGEYQGEVISMEMFEKRKKEYQGERHFYFMTLTGKLVIDASRKSQFTRFVNHSCEPNAETQKWNAGGEPRVGIFALREIRKSEEITFDYGARSLANDTVPCLCGTNSCRGFLTISKKPESKRGEDDEVMFDTSGFVKTADDMKQLPLQAKVVGPASKSDSENLQESVQKKIHRAKKDITFAEDIAERMTGLHGTLKTFDECVLEDSVKKKLSDWVVSVKQASRKRRDMFSLNGSISKAEARMRIPRRPEPPRTESFLESYLRKDSEEKNSVKTGIARKNGPVKPFPRKPPIHKSSSVPKFSPPSKPESGARQPWRSSAQHDDQKSSKLEERKDTRRTIVDIHGSRSAKPVPPVEHRPLRRRLPAFVPNAPKIKKPLPKPKVAKREKPKRDDSDDDSMDNYSVASSAEPVIEEDPPLSISDLPDGLGACSDDEFVAAPPVGTTASRHREEERIDPRTRKIVTSGEGRDYQSLSKLEVDKQRASAANAESFADRHRDNPDLSRRLPEQHVHEGSRNPVEERGIRAATATHDRQGARPLDGRRSRRPGPELDRLPTVGPPGTAHDSPERGRADSSRNLRAPDPNRHPKGGHDENLRSPMQRPHHDNFVPQSPGKNWDESASRSFDRGLPPFAGSDPDKEPERKNKSLGGRPVYAEDPEFRAPGRSDGSRGELRLPLETDTTVVNHGMPPGRRETWGSDGNHGLPLGRRGPLAAGLGRRDDGGHGVLPRRESRWADDISRRPLPQRGERWRDDIDHGAPSRRDDRWGDDTSGGVPPRRDMWSADMSPGRHPRGRDMRSEEMRRAFPLSPRRHPRGRDMRGEEMGHVFPPSPGRHPRGRDMRGEDIRHPFPLSPGRRPRGRDMRGGEMRVSLEMRVALPPSPGRRPRGGDMRGEEMRHALQPSPGRHPRGRDMRGEEMRRPLPPSPGRHPRGRAMRLEEERHPLALPREQMWRDEGMDRGFNQATTGRRRMKRGSDSRLQRDRAGLRHPQVTENHRSSRFSHLDDHAPRSRDSFHGLSDGKEVRKTDNVAPTDVTTHLKDKKDEKPGQDDRDQRGPVQAKENPLAAKASKPSFETSADVQGDRSIAADQELGPPGAESRLNSAKPELNGGVQAQDGAHVQHVDLSKDRTKLGEAIREPQPSSKSHRGLSASSPRKSALTQSDPSRSPKASKTVASALPPDDYNKLQRRSPSNLVLNKAGKSTASDAGCRANSEHAKPRSPGAPKLSVKQISGVADKMEKRDASGGMPETCKSGDGEDDKVVPAKMHATKGTRFHERSPISRSDKKASQGSGNDGRNTMPRVEGVHQRDTGKPTGHLPRESDMRKSSKHRERREGDASISRDGITEKDKSVMHRIGRRPGDGTDVRGNGNVGTDQIRKSRSGGNIRDRRRRSDGSNEHGRKRFRGDGAGSPRWEGSHGPSLHRRKSADMGGVRQSSSGTRRPHHSSDRRDRDQAQGPKGSGGLGKQPTAFSKNTAGANPSKSNSDLRSLIKRRKTGN